MRCNGKTEGKLALVRTLNLQKYFKRSVAGDRQEPSSATSTSSAGRSGGSSGGEPCYGAGHAW